MTIEYAASVGGFVIAAILIWRQLRVIRKKFRVFDTRFREMRMELNELHAVKARLFIAEMNAQCKVEAPQDEPRNAPVESNGGGGASQPARVQAPSSDNRTLGQEPAPLSRSVDAGTSFTKQHKLDAEPIAAAPPARDTPSPVPAHPKPKSKKRSSRQVDDVSLGSRRTPGG
jgi:hypothetical protein